jgi:DinB family protein
MGSLVPILELLQMSRTRFIAKAGSVAENLWRKSPDTDTWSTAEVVAHVTIAEQFIIARSKTVLQVPPKQLPLLKKFDLLLLLVAWRVRKRKTPIPMDSSLIADRPEALNRLATAREGTLAFIESTRGQDLSVYRLPHPFLGSLKVYDWLRTIAYHQLRHAQQIRELVETIHH